MIRSTNFYPFNYVDFHKITCEIFPKIIIPAIIHKKESIEYIIMKLYFIINNLFHEQYKD